MRYTTETCSGSGCVASKKRCCASRNCTAAPDDGREKKSTEGERDKNGTDGGQWMTGCSAGFRNSGPDGRFRY
jgi:hypothetical protein